MKYTYLRKVIGIEPVPVKLLFSREVWWAERPHPYQAWHVLFNDEECVHAAVKRGSKLYRSDYECWSDLEIGQTYLMRAYHCVFKQYKFTLVRRPEDWANAGLTPPLAGIP